MRKEEKIPLIKNEDTLLLKRFNRREPEAFGCVYSKYYNDFFRYAAYLYIDTEVDPKDILQDIFIKLWQDNSISFNAFEKLRAYIFTTIKNSFLNHITHKNVQQSYINTQIEKHDYDLFECEIYSYVEEALNILPEECRKVFKLYIEGYKPDAIAKELGKSIQTVYNMKQIAVQTLKKKLDPRKLQFILSVFVAGF